MEYYWYDSCSVCGFGGGGRLAIFEDTTNRLYLHCANAVSFLDPEKAQYPVVVSDPGHRFHQRGPARISKPFGNTVGERITPSISSPGESG